MKKIPLTQNKFALISDCDFEIVSKYKWHLNVTHGGKEYAETKINGKNVSMPAFLNY